MADDNKNNIDKALEALNLGLDMEPDSGIDVPVENNVEFDPDFELQEDGSAIVNPENDIPELSFDSNLADFVDEFILVIPACGFKNLLLSFNTSCSDGSIDEYILFLCWFGVTASVLIT